MGGKRFFYPKVIINMCILNQATHSHIDPFPLTGFGPEQTCSRLFSSLGAQCEEIPDPRLLNPCFQIILPDHRIDFFNDKEKLLKEMEREFAVHVEDIRTNVYIGFTNL